MMDQEICTQHRAKKSRVTPEINEVFGRLGRVPAVVLTCTKVESVVLRASGVK